MDFLLTPNKDSKKDGGKGFSIGAPKLSFGKPSKKKGLDFLGGTSKKKPFVFNFQKNKDVNPSQNEKKDSDVFAIKKPNAPINFLHQKAKHKPQFSPSLFGKKVNSVEQTSKKPIEKKKSRFSGIQFKKKSIFATPQKKNKEYVEEKDLFKTPKSKKPTNFFVTPTSADSPMDSSTPKTTIANSPVNNSPLPSSTIFKTPKAKVPKKKVQDSPGTVEIDRDIEMKEKISFAQPKQPRQLITLSNTIEKPKPKPKPINLIKNTNNMSNLLGSNSFNTKFKSTTGKGQSQPSFFKRPVFKKPMTKKYNPQKKPTFNFNPTSNVEANNERIKKVTQKVQNEEKDLKQIEKDLNEKIDSRQTIGSTISEINTKMDEYVDQLRDINVEIQLKNNRLLMLNHPSFDDKLDEIEQKYNEFIGGY